MQRVLKIKKSSNIHGARYDPDTETLELDLNGGTWAHFGVGQDKVDDFVSAKSHGEHHAKFIKDQHETKRVK